MACVLTKYLGLATLIICCCGACTGPFVYDPAQNTPTRPALHQDHAVMEDGYHLPLLRLEPEPSPPHAIVIALHGLNDYSHAFQGLGQHLVHHGIGLIAYDQRGFGRTEGVGFWHGTSTLSRDLLTVISLVKKKYQKTPLYLLGESMGGAVVLSTLTSLQDHNTVRGVVLIAPAIWATSTMPWYQQFALWFFSHSFPWMTFSGQGLGIEPSDNIEMLRALGRDPMVIKKTRADVIYGLSTLMENALAQSAEIQNDTLILYGKKDQIIPREPTCMMLEQLSVNHADKVGVILYDNGFHMLTRDLGAINVLDDITTWIKIKNVPGATQYKYSTTQEIEAFCSPHENGL